MSVLEKYKPSLHHMEYLWLKFQSYHILLIKHRWDQFKFHSNISATFFVFLHLMYKRMRSHDLQRNRNEYHKLNQKEFRRSEKKEYKFEAGIRLEWRQDKKHVFVRLNRKLDRLHRSIIPLNHTFLELLDYLV